MSKTIFYLLLPCFLLTACSESNTSSKSFSEVELVNELNLYDSSNYNLNSGGTNFIAFGENADNVAKQKYDEILKEDGFTDELVEIRKLAYKDMEKINLEMSSYSGWKDIDTYVSKNRTQIDENILGSRIIQETAIRILYDLIKISEERDLTDQEKKASKKYTLLLNDYNFPDIVFIYKSISIGKELYTESELTEIASNTKENSNFELENCGACFIKGKRSEFEVARDQYFQSQKEALSITN